MENLYPILKNIPLFDNIQEENYECVLHCLKAHIKQYEKGEYIYGINSLSKISGIIISGKINLTMLNKAGSEHNIRHLEKNDILLKNDEYNNIQAVSTEKTKILTLYFSEVYSKDKAETCPHILQITLNLLKISNKENLYLNQKIEILAQKKMRDKINTYIKSLIKKSDIIKLPFNRQELANFLGVDRSALSRELCYMRDEGLINFNKNTITINDMSEFS